MDTSSENIHLNNLSDSREFVDLNLDILQDTNLGRYFNIEREELLLKIY